MRPYSAASRAASILFRTRNFALMRSATRACPGDVAGGMREMCLLELRDKSSMLMIFRHCRPRPIGAHSTRRRRIAANASLRHRPREPEECKQIRMELACHPFLI